jgi:hypothetical protein
LAFFLPKTFLNLAPGQQPGVSFDRGRLALRATGSHSP